MFFLLFFFFLFFFSSLQGEEGSGFDVLVAKFGRSNTALKDLIAYYKER